MLSAGRSVRYESCVLSQGYAKRLHAAVLEGDAGLIAPLPICFGVYIGTEACPPICATSVNCMALGEGTPRRLTINQRMTFSEYNYKFSLP